MPGNDDDEFEDIEVPMPVTSRLIRMRFYIVDLRVLMIQFVYVHQNR